MVLSKQHDTYKRILAGSDDFALILIEVMNGK